MSLAYEYCKGGRGEGGYFESHHADVPSLPNGRSPAFLGGARPGPSLRRVASRRPRPVRGMRVQAAVLPRADDRFWGKACAALFAVSGVVVLATTAFAVYLDPEVPALVSSSLLVRLAVGGGGGEPLSSPMRQCLAHIEPSPLYAGSFRPPASTVRTRPHCFDWTVVSRLSL